MFCNFLENFSCLGSVFTEPQRCPPSRNYHCLWLNGNVPKLVDPIERFRTIYCYMVFCYEWNINSNHKMWLYLRLPVINAERHNSHNTDDSEYHSKRDKSLCYNIQLSSLFNLSILYTINLCFQLCPHKFMFILACLSCGNQVWDKARTIYWSFLGWKDQ